MDTAGDFRLSALVLAGGQGSRLGGRDKGLMLWHGQPVAALMVAMLETLSDEVLISCNRNHQQYRNWSDHLVSDAEQGFPGPLAGILSGLQYCHGSHLLVVPCDMPRLDEHLLQALVQQAKTAPQRPWVVRCGDQWQPLLVVLPKALLASLHKAWERGVRSPRQWLLAQPHGVLALPADDSRLYNANYLPDWESG